MDAVIHLGARATFESYSRVRASIVDGSRSLMQAAAASGVRRFVYGSSLFVYPGHAGPIGPATKTGPRLGYGRAKLEAEGRRPHWRFKLEPGEIAWDDLVRGSRALPASAISDFVLARSGGAPGGGQGRGRGDEFRVQQ